MQRIIRLFLIRFADKIFDRIDELAELICMKDSHLKAEMRKLGIETPKFELRLTPIGVTLCESISNVAIKFTGDKRRDHQNYISGLGYLLCPSWAYKNFFTRKDIT